MATPRAAWALLGNKKRSIHWHDPDVAERDRVAMVLQLERAGRPLVVQAPRRLLGNFEVVVDHYAIVPNRDASVFRFHPCVIELRRGEIYVVGLPRERRQAH